MTDRSFFLENKEINTNNKINEELERKKASLPSSSLPSSSIVFLSPSELITTIHFWSSRFVEHCIVLLFYVNQFNFSSPLQYPKVVLEKNNLLLQILNQLQKWHNFSAFVCQVTECKPQKNKEEKEESPLFIPQKIPPPPVLNTLVTEFNTLSGELNTLKTTLIELRKNEIHTHRGPISLALLEHVRDELLKSQQLINGSITKEELKKYMLKEVSEHLAYIATRIDPFPFTLKHIQETLEYAAEFEKRAQLIQTKESLQLLLDESKEILYKIFSYKQYIIDPEDFIKHEIKETQFWKWISDIFF